MVAARAQEGGGQQRLAKKKKLPEKIEEETTRCWHVERGVNEAANGAPEQKNDKGGRAASYPTSGTDYGELETGKQASLCG